MKAQIGIFMDILAEWRRTRILGVLAVSAVLLGVVPAVADVSSGLLGYWKFDGAKTGQVVDSSGLGNVGSISGNPGWTKGQFDNAINLTNTADCVLLTESQALSTGTKTFTFWAKLASNKNYNMVYADKRGDYIAFNSAGDMRVTWRNAAGVGKAADYRARNVVGTWTFYAVVFDVDGSNVSLSCYKDGALTYTSSDNSGITASPLVCLGARNAHGSLSLDGALDECRVYGRALTPSEIDDVFSGAQPDEDGEPPTPCGNLTATSVIANEVHLAWDAATDNVYVTGYRVYRDGTCVGTSPTNTFADLGVSEQSRYTYTVTAYDGMDNESAHSAPLEVSTPAKPADWPTARFTVAPGTNVEVGVAVLLDGSSSTDDRPFEEVVGSYPNERATDFDWDFGDGYVMNRGTFDKDNGPVCLHYFMQPGTFNVTLTVTDTDGNRDSMVQQIRVTGEAPVPGFELWHAPFHARIAQYIYAQIPASLRAHRLHVTLTSDTGHRSTLVDKTGLLSEEKFLLNHRNLPAGSFVMQADILDGTTRVTRVREKFARDLVGIPRVGIDEHNAIRVDDKPFFPITPWLLGKSSIRQWSRYCNTLYGQGYVDGNKTPASWLAYLDEAQANGMLAIGPEVWDGRAPVHFHRQSDVKRMRSYLDACKDHPANFGYSWNDEPNLGGRGMRNPPQVIAAWNYITSTNDAQHPTQINFYGAEFSTYLGDPNIGIAPYAFVHNAEHFGGKRHCVADIIGLDEYVLEYYAHPSMNQGDLAAEGIMANWIKLLENMKKWNHNLVPFTQFVENQDVANARMVLSGNNRPGPTSDQVRMEFWVSVVHGCHMVNYFNLRLDRNPANQGVLEENLNLVTKYADVILGPESSAVVTDDANVRGKRVDTLVRETDDDIYVFAIRITEPDFSQTDDNLPPEDESVDVTFSVQGEGTGLVRDEFHTMENVCDYLRVTSPRRSFGMTLSQPPVPGTVSVSGVFEVRNVYYSDEVTVPDPNWMYAYDTGNGRFSGDLYGVRHSGLVDYGSGEVTVTFSRNVLAGTNNLAVSYTPVRSVRALNMVDGQFSDTFRRGGLHIYRIPKTVGTRKVPAPLSNLR